MATKDWEKDEPQGFSEDPNVIPSAPEKFTLRDIDQKVLVLDCGTLKAVPDKKGVHRETFFVSASNWRSASEKKGSPVVLAVSKGELFLCCVKDKGQSHPSLKLKKKQLKDLRARNEPAVQPFIFYKAKEGLRYTLESAAHPGWFICTSGNSGEPVTVTNERGKKEYTEFDFVRLPKLK